MLWCCSSVVEASQRPASAFSRSNVSRALGSPACAPAGRLDVKAHVRTTTTIETILIMMMSWSLFRREQVVEQVLRAGREGLDAREVGPAIRGQPDADPGLTGGTMGRDAQDAGAEVVDDQHQLALRDREQDRPAEPIAGARDAHRRSRFAFDREGALPEQPIPHL